MEVNAISYRNIPPNQGLIEQQVVRSAGTSIGAGAAQGQIQPRPQILTQGDILTATQAQTPAPHVPAPEEQPQQLPEDEKGDKKNGGFLEKFYTGAKNSADLTDAILVPRTIFKGYLGIMSGTALITIGTLLGKHPKISHGFSIIGTLLPLYGTYAFVRPYIIKGTKGVQTEKDV